MTRHLCKGPASRRRSRIRLVPPPRRSGGGEPIEAWWRGCLASSVQRSPDALGGCRAGKLGGAERRQRVADGVADRREGGDGARFAAVLNAQWVGRAARRVEGEREGRQVVGSRQRVIHQRAGQKLAGNGVVAGVL